MAAGPPSQHEEEHLTIKSFRRPRALALAMVQLLVAGAFIAFTATAADAAPTGATATKDCPDATVDDPYTIGDTVKCTATFVNAGEHPATMTSHDRAGPVHH